MRARFQKLLGAIHETFWLLPGLMVCGGVLAAFGLIAVDRGGWLPKAVLEGPWLYNGGGTGARTLLGAVASSTIGVAGTVFSITIAALSLAAGQMGPRLLRNFVRDRGNQFTLGTFLATFAYALMVLRSVRSQSEGEFVPHLSLTVAIVLAMICVATLVFFVGHMAGRINVDVVIELVSDDVRSAIQRLTSDIRTPEPPPAAFWRSATAVVDSRRGYLQQLDEKGLANWAHEHKTHIRMLIRPGHYVFPGAPIALIVRHRRAPRRPSERRPHSARNAPVLRTLSLRSVIWSKSRFAHSRPESMIRIRPWGCSIAWARRFATSCTCTCIAGSRNARAKHAWSYLRLITMDSLMPCFI